MQNFASTDVDALTFLPWVYLLPFFFIFLSQVKLSASSLPPLGKIILRRDHHHQCNFLFFILFIHEFWLDSKPVSANTGSNWQQSVHFGANWHESENRKKGLVTDVWSVASTTALHVCACWVQVQWPWSRTHAS